MGTTRRRSRLALALIAALLAALVVSACGSSNSGGSSKSASNKTASTTSTSSTSAAGNTTSRTAFASCLKQHGVTLPKGFGRFNRGAGAPGTGTGTTPSGTGSPPSGAPNGAAGGGFPGGGGGGFAGGFGAGNSKFAKAFQACRSKLGSSGFGPGRFGRGGPGGRGGFGLRFSATTLKSYVACIRKNGYAAMPNPNTTGKGSVFPAKVETNAKFKTANVKCETILRRAFRPPAGGAGGAVGGGTAGGTPAISGTSSVSSA